ASSRSKRLSASEMETAALAGRPFFLAHRNQKHLSKSEIFDKIRFSKSEILYEIRFFKSVLLYLQRNTTITPLWIMQIFNR
ncbi:MAG: hypothetical protein K2F84_06335, partial [Bacteroidales bacterium]|nr:hypothetical protein [Bacteroidales bacterium]